ncbi:MAG: hypothetical protein AAGA75_12275 [Cyanobacteria bacterium P01_E01_bin.6]
MPTQNICVKALLPLSLFLLLAVTACSKTSSDTSNDGLENSQPSVNASQVDASQIDASEVGTSEIDASEVGTSELGASEIDASEVDASDLQSPEEESTADSAVDVSTENVQNVFLALSGDGLLIIDGQSGGTQTIPFDTDIVMSQAAISPALGEPTEVTQNSECGAGPMRFITWPNELTMNEMQNQFVGWTVSPDTESANLTTMDGVGLGKALTDLEANYRVDVIESTLGTEFNASDSLFGLLSANEPDGVITFLWSGTACNFR